MYDYGEACPISRASSILCERWTLQSVRELHLGASRFSEFQRYMPRISPSLLNARLKLLEEGGIVVKRRIPEERGHEYLLAPAAKALGPVLNEIGKWGMQWGHEGIADEALNAVVLLRRGRREVCDENPGCEVDVRFRSTLRTLSEIFWGDRSITSARESGDLRVVGTTALTRRLSKWVPVSSFAKFNRARRNTGKLPEDSASRLGRQPPGS